jgi:integrase
MRAKITKRTVDSLNADRADLLVWDTEVKGFGLRCRAAGAKFYVVKFRAAHRQRWLTIGRHGSPWTPEMARIEAKKILGEIADGGDPAMIREDERRTLTVRQLGERFYGEHVTGKRKPSTAVSYRDLLGRFIYPAIGSHTVPTVTRADVVRLHHEMQATPYQANRALSVLSKMMNWAEQQGYRPDGTNPCRHVERYKEQSRERFLSPTELAELGGALTRAEKGEMTSPYAVAAIRLLIFTGARLGEVLGLQWAYVDMDNAVVRLPDSKTGAKTVHLPPPALEVLSALHRIEGNPYVIVGARDWRPLVNLEKPWRAIRKMAGLDDVRLHDLRHSFASMGAGAGLGLPVIGALLGHAQPQTTARYAHLANDPLRQAANLIAGRIGDAMAGRSGGMVVDMQGRKPPA